MPRRSGPRLVTPDPASTRLAIAELLLRTDDPSAAAEHVTDWLVQHAGAEEALCVAKIGTRLVGLAGRGLPAESVRSLGLDLDDVHHPMVDCWHRAAEATVVREGSYGLEPSPLASRTVVMVPLVAPEAAEPVGLLLIGAPEPRALAEARWVAAPLAHRLRAGFLAQAVEQARRRLTQEHS